MQVNGIKPLIPTVTLVFVLAGIGIFLNCRKSSVASVMNQKKIDEVQLSNQSEVITRERLYTQIEIDQMTEATYASLLTDIERRLPQNDELEKMPENVLVHIPEIVLEAGRNLGLIREVLTKHKSFEKMAIPFYEKCSLNSNSPSAVRAICLTHLLQFKKNKGEKVSLKQYPKEVVNISKMVVDL